ITCANDLAFITLIDKIVRDSHRTRPELRCTGSLYPYTFQQLHSPVHLEAEVRYICRLRLFEMFDQRGLHVIWKLPRSFLLPFRKNAFGVDRRKLPLDPILKLKV